MSQAIAPEARAEVMRRLADVQRRARVRILLAVESGSRAWGFASPDSDYDARFIFVRPADDYLSLFPPRDVIETPIEGLYDVNGWDLSKALKLMMRGNSVVQEWLASPIAYVRDEPFLARLTPIAARWRSRFADAHHYAGLLGTQRARFIAGREQVKLKKYFYVVRPAMALQWLRDRPGEAPPMDLPRLRAGVRLPEAVAAALNGLQEVKARTTELGEGPRISVLDAYVEEMWSWAATARERPPPADPDLIAETDALFRETVRAG